MAFSIQIVGHEKILRAIDAAPVVAGEEITTAIMVGTHHMRSAVQNHTPRGATKLLYRSMQAEITGMSLNTMGRVYSNDVPVKVASVEHGRRPGKMPPWGPGSSLALWVTRIAGGGPGAAFLIARAIGRRGTKGAKMFEKGFREGEGRVTGMFSQVLSRIVQRSGF